MSEHLRDGMGGYDQISYPEYRLRYIVGVIEKPLSFNHNHDRSYVDVYEHAFAVMDGVSGGEHPDVAATLAKKMMSNVQWTSGISGVKDTLLSFFTSVRSTLIFIKERSSTTITALKIVITDEGTFAVIRNAGDSGCLLWRDGRIVDCTVEQNLAAEGRPHVITNSLSARRRGDLDQEYVWKLRKGDKILLYTDGITGDEDTDKLKLTEVADAFNQSTAQKSAEYFLHYSKKYDDKTAIVLFFEGEDDDKNFAVSDLRAIR